MCWGGFMNTSSAPSVPLVSPASLTVSLVRQRHPAVGRNRIYEAIANGVLAGVRVGKRLAIPVDEVDEWVAAGAPTESSETRSPRFAHKHNTPRDLPLAGENS